jgi:hypothetical protein
VQLAKQLAERDAIVRRRNNTFGISQCNGLFLQFSKQLTQRDDEKANVSETPLLAVGSVFCFS